MFAERDRLKGLLDYVEATERDRLSVALDVADHQGFRRFRDDVFRLPGVLLDQRAGDDEVWLSVDRLVRSPPPAIPDAELRPWVSLSNDPATAPVLKTQLPRAALKVFTAGEADGGAEATHALFADHPDRPRLEASFGVYKREIWSSWVVEEKPRRAAIDLYNALFALRQSLEGTADRPIELVWGIGIAHWAQPSAKLRYPLLTVAVELALNEASHAIEVRPRLEASPVLEADAPDLVGAQGLTEWRLFAQAHIAALTSDGLSPFAAETFLPILRRATALMHPDATFMPDLGERHPPEDGVLRIDADWVLFERPRRATQLMDDLRRLSGAVDSLTTAAALPPAVLALLQQPGSAPRTEEYPDLRGVSTIPGVTSADGSGADLFFPKPFNREQVEVIQRLSVRPGVVVQGPPGTGKTHTIANIISHYLALGKRVLVTSQKAPALKVLRDKLPDAVRPLAVSLLDSDRDGLKQFQESVDIIADRLQRTRPVETRAQIAAVDTQIDALHRDLARMDGEVDRIGRAAMSSVTVDGHITEPATAARRIVATGDLGAWLPDPIDAIASHEPDFNDVDVATLRAARKRVGERLAAIDAPLPPADLPSAGEVLALHDMLLEAENAKRALTADKALRDGVDVTAVMTLMAQLDGLQAATSSILDAPFSWTTAMLDRLRADADDPVAHAILGLRPQVDALTEEVRHFLVRPVTLPDGALDDASFRDAVDALARGETRGLLQSLFARQTEQRLAAIRLAARAPADPHQWAEIARYMAALADADRLSAIWNHAAAAANMTAVTTGGLAGPDEMRRQLAHLAALRSLVDDEEAIDGHARRILSGWQRSAWQAATDLRDVLTAHVRRLKLEEARIASAALEQKLASLAGSLGQDLRAAADLIGRGDCDRGRLDRLWSAALEEAAVRRGLQTDYDVIRRVTHLIAESGAPLWAAQLRATCVQGQEDPLTPGDWRERWTLRRLSTWLDRIDSHGRLRTLSAERSEAERRLARAYEEAIELRTWCRLAEQATDQTRSALAAYAQSMRRIGRGTGVRAGRHRADARAAADRAKDALPCWIMPHYRVSESLPAELGLFDLVIVDEASQSTLAALPALLRAKQILIVGDDRQVSPDAGFREEARLSLLAERHLADQVADYRATMREDRSLYDLGSVVFAGGAILLKEHFRCVAPIIEYSKAQFYSHQLVPLRLPSASERLDPPLVDILVEDGHRRGKVNPPEVDCIVDEIGRIADDPSMADRTIGVTTLLGHEQASAIMKAIEQVLGAEVMIRHDIRVGEPAAFQGDERDIMFVSLVADRNSSALSGLPFEQRFNVAASRARDRMVLVRSVELEQLRPSDKLRRSLIEHFHAPFAAESSLVEDRRAACESAFETEMFDLLVERGYRVDTQVRVGTKRIDLVVEGSDDRRLGIECDGDRYHGPDRWPEDMARQRMLERAGWTIWRCFASRFVRERDAVVAELIATLTARGITPELDRNQPLSRHTEHRRWRSVAAVTGEHVPYAWLVPAEPFDASTTATRDAA